MAGYLAFGGLVLKTLQKASVYEKRFIRFQETENGGFRKRISVDRALIQHATKIPITIVILTSNPNVST